LLAGGAGLVLAFCSGYGGPAAADDILVQDLLKKLEERDSTILDLAKRVQQLEQRLDAAEAAPDPSAAPAGTASGAAAAGAAASGRTTAQAPASPQPSSPQPAAAPVADPGAPAAPGTFAVDPEAAERALERTLVQTGALLLPLGAVDVEPGFTYVRRETTAPVLFEEISLEGDSFTNVARQDLRENDLTGALGLRLGLPWASQFELSVPFVYKDQSRVFLNTEESADALGLGDVSVGLAKELVRERGWRPDLLARVTWGADTGQEKDGIELGSGFHSITGSLTALKQQDPLAFFASGFYRTSFEKDDVEPGDEFGFTIGTVLAASPDTSLSVSLQQTFSRELKVGGRLFPGSDQVSGILAVGASSVLGRGLLLSVNAGVGLTDDAPDYFVGVSLPIRFNLPVQ
jgi:hypothetical protein